MLNIVREMRTVKHNGDIGSFCFVIYHVFLFTSLIDTNVS